jgi:hypothetical protein
MCPLRIKKEWDHTIEVAAQQRGHGGVVVPCAQALASAGCGKYKGTHPVGVIDGDPLGDPAPHRMAIDVSGVDACRLKDSDRVGRKRLRGVTVGVAPAAATDPTVIEADHAEMLRQCFRGGPPSRHSCGLAGNKEQRLARALLGPGQLGAVSGQSYLHLCTVTGGVLWPLWCSAR